jgi:AcrR family transcriptional regulator
MAAKKSKSKSSPKTKAAPSRSLFEIVESPLGKGDIKIAEIIEATIRCLSTVGIEHTSFEAVGQEAGLLKAHVNYYFKEKDDLIKGVLDYVLAKAQRMTVEALQKQEDPALLLKTLSDVTFDWAEANRAHLPLIVLLYYQCTINPKLRETHTRARALARERLVEILKHSGLKASPAKLETYAFAIHALLSGYIVEFSATKTSHTLSELKRDAYQNILRILGKA